MKIALVTDLHFGARGDSVPFDNFFKKFYDDTFFPYLVEHGIKTIFDLGDTFDRRKYINFNSLRSCKEYFFDKARDLGIDIHMIPGNHDTYFKNTNDVNSPDLLLKEYSNISIYEGPTEITMGKTKILFLPWICTENYNEIMEKVQNTSATICFGHFEFLGYQMYRGTPNPHGMDPGIFSNFHRVISGHFHHRHTRGNITYMGNPYEITWADHDDPRGFAIFNCDNQEIEYVDNPNTMFAKLYYDDSEPGSMAAFNNYPFEHLQSKCVRLIVVKKTNISLFEKFIDNLYQQNLIELKIIEDLSEFEDNDVGEDVDLEDTMTLLKEYVDGIELNVDKEKLKNMLQTLYVEAQDVA